MERNSLWITLVSKDIKKNTIYKIIKRYENNGTIKRKPGSGRKPRIMTAILKKRLIREFNHKDGVSLRNAAKKYNCSHVYIWKTLKNNGINKRQKKRSPEYTEEQINKIRQNCGILYRKSRGKIFILDDEKYFTLSAPQMPGNNIYYTSNPFLTPPEVKLKFKKKFEAKLMLYIAISENGISKPYFRRSGLAINKDVYKNNCLNKILIPFIRQHHSNSNYLFWPDKASAHYALSVTNFLREKNIPFVEYNENPTNVPQCRPIEDFFGYLSQLVYKGGWKAKDTKQLKRRIKKCMKEIDFEKVQKSFSEIRQKLWICSKKGPYNLIH